ncbi:MAG: hypothetical protein HY678_03580 [Chloroflexi bacterium]|nr:hypothetical protein [Chloroflexota bacterium]
MIDPARLNQVAGVFGRMVDLKSTYTLGHSIGVAALAEGASRAAGFPAGDVATPTRRDEAAKNAVQLRSEVINAS